MVCRRSGDERGLDLVATTGSRVIPGTPDNQASWAGACCRVDKGDAMWGPMSEYGWGMGGFGLWGGLMMVLVWGALIVLVVAIAKWLLGGRAAHTPHARSGNSAQDILDERYARGEIDREEYLQRREDLR